MTGRQPPQPKIEVPAGFVSFPAENLDMSIVSCFENSADKHSERVAVDQDGRRVTYRILNRISEELAHSILAMLGPGEEPVALVLEQTAGTIGALLGTLKAGKVYAVLDPSNPPDRLSAILDDLRPRLILTNNANLARAEQAARDSVQVLNIDTPVSHQGFDCPSTALSPESPAGIYYTSGSTGVPKGAVYSHRGILHFAMSVINTFFLSPDDRQPLQFSLGFAWSISPVFGMLLSGGTLFPADFRAKTMSQLEAWLQEKEITIFQAPSSLFRQFVNSLSPGQRHLPRLRLMVTGGEPLLAKDAQTWRGIFAPKSVLIYSLASTEAGLISLQSFAQDSDIQDGNLPLGFAAIDKQILLFDESGNEVPAGESGEIAVRSRYLIDGYWNRPDLTRRTFVLDPGDTDLRTYFTGDLGCLRAEGALEYLGRRDSQIKIRGYRVDRAEIENVLCQMPAVKDAVVAPRPARHNPAQLQLTSYIVPREKDGLTAAQVRGFLTIRLPEYMVPTYFVFLEKIPTNLNGKVDFRALPEPGKRQELSDFDLPSDDVEKQLLEIWKKAFSLDIVSVQDDFFDLGGDSLTASALFSEVERRFGRLYPLNMLMEYGTVQKFAQVLRNPDKYRINPLVELKPGAASPPLFLLPGAGGDVLPLRDLAMAIDMDQPVYGLEIAGFNRVTKYAKPVEDVAAELLSELKKVQPSGPYCLAGYSYGGIVAFEMAHQLTKAGERVDLVGLIDTYPPGTRRNSSLGHRIHLHLENLRVMNWKGRCRYFLQSAAQIPLKIARFKPWRRFSSLNMAATSDPLEISYKAMTLYRPDPYPGKVAIFTVSDRPKYIHWDVMEPWKRIISGELEVHNFPGGHFTMLKQPHVQALAKVMAECIRRCREIRPSQSV